MLNLLNDTTADLSASDALNSRVPIIKRSTMALGDLDLKVGTTDKGGREFTVGIDGQGVSYTDRFGTSLLGLLGQGKSVFDLFNPEEVLERAIDRDKLKEVTITTATDRQTGFISALAASKVDKQRVAVQDIGNIIDASFDNSDGPGDRTVTGVDYTDGIITLRHQPTIEMPNFDIAGDVISPQFFTEIPIDGYGNPNAYVGILREVCANGMIAMAKAFRHNIQLGNGGKKDDAGPGTILTRFFATYNNEDGYSALRERLEAAAVSPASLDEFYKLFQILNAAAHPAEGDTRTFIDDEVNVTSTFNDIGGDTLREYGLTSLNALSQKVRSRVPVEQCTIYDLTNVATEVASHHCDPATARKLHGFVGTMISDTYDLEGLFSEEQGGPGLRDHQGKFFEQGTVISDDVKEEIAMAKDNDAASALLMELN